MRTIFIFITCFLFTRTCMAQDSSLLSMLNDSLKYDSSSFRVKATFKAIHIVNSHTIESPAKKDLNFIIMHRFGKINDGAYNFFGLDRAFIRLGLDYGITDRLGIGIGRSTLEKTFDGYIKYKLLQQTVGQKIIPLSISILGTITNNTFPKMPGVSAKDRNTYVTQFLIARKMTSSFSLQVSPTFIHFNKVPTVDKKDVFAAMVGGRIKLTKRTSFTAEYNYLLPGQVKSIDVKNSLSLGFDIETGGHVFQLIFSNSSGMTEPQYIARTIDSWGKGGIFFGFNVSRNFSLGKNKKKPKW